MEDYVPEIVRLVKESAEIEFRESGFHTNVLCSICGV